MLLSEAVLGADFLIVANGEWNPDIVKEYMPNRIVIVLDGAAEKFYRAGLTPDIILGDFDSIQGQNAFNVDAALAYFKNIPPPHHLEFESYATYYTFKGEERSILYYRTSCQDYSDLDKAIRFCMKDQKPNEHIDIHVLGALGGERIDHLFQNFSILKKHKLPNVTIKILGNYQAVQFFKDEKVTLSGPIGGYFGAFGYPHGSIVSQGLKWELDRHYPLEIGHNSSACNELTQKTIHLDIQGDVLIISPLINHQQI